MYMTTQILKKCNTESNIFIRGMLGYSQTFYGSTFFNTYLAIEPESMYLVFNKAENERQKSYQETKFSILKNNKDYLSSSETEDFHILVLNIPIKYMDDFYKILEGKFSKTSEEYKQLILMLAVPYSNERTKLFKIFYPQEEDVEALAEFLDVELPKDAEIKSKMNLRDELFDYRHLTRNTG